MKREQFLRELRKLAKDRRLELNVYEDKGKGSHYRIQCGGKISTLKSGDLTPMYMRLVKKQLGLE